MKAIRTLQGLGVSPGIGVGIIVRVSSRGGRVFRLWVEPTRVDWEVQRLMAAIEKAREQLWRSKRKLEEALGEKHGYILDAHLLMLEDRRLIQEIKSVIQTQHVNAEWAVKVVIDRILAIYSEVKDEYLRERGSDIEDVANRLIMTLSGDQPSRQLPPEAILVTEQILPSLVAEFDLDAVAGLAARTGGLTSHAAIIARGLGIPAIVGVNSLDSGVESGSQAIVDGNRGRLIINPTPESVSEYRQRRAEDERLWCSVLDRTQLPARTRDGVHITLRANLELPSEVPAIRQNGAQGVGLFRTQYLFLPSAPEPPSEEEQFTVYRQLAEACGTDGVVIRTFDLAEAKLRTTHSQSESNPAMGLRAIRFSLQAEEMFSTQLRAILRAACYGKIHVVLPLVSTVTELRRSRQLLQSVTEDLERQGVAHGATVPLGVMIEVPAAVMIADVLAAEADFFSLGTNDLIQYLLAVDRDNNRVAYLYQAFHPAVLRALERTVRTAGEADIPVEVCGEMASDPVQALMLIGLGLRRLSMAPKAIPFVKDVIRSVDTHVLEETMATALNLESAEQVKDLLTRQWADMIPALSKR